MKFTHRSDNSFKIERVAGWRFKLIKTIVEVLIIKVVTLVISFAMLVIMSALSVTIVATIVTMAAMFDINVATMVIVNGTFVTADPKSAERVKNVFFWSSRG